MKHLRIPMTILAFATAMVAKAQEKEVLIIGTMHTVPPIVKHCYAPLLRKAMEYRPEAILTEDIMPEDSLSLSEFTPEFVRQAEESAASHAVDADSVRMLMAKPLGEMAQEDFSYLATAFLQRKDRANYLYYSYLASYGIKGCRKPLRNESDDVTHKLAIAMGIRKLLPIDSHHNDKAYNQAWSEAVRSGAENGDLEKYNRIQRRITSRQNINGILGSLGRFTNRRSTLEAYHETNSLRYADHPNDDTELAMALWDERNLTMARNIIRQMEGTDARRFILIVGAGHVISLENAVKALRNGIEVKTLYR